MNASEMVVLDFPEDVIHFPLPRYDEPQLLWKIVLDLLPLCDMLTEKGEAIAESFNQKVTCKKGCGVCCCQMVPLSAPEAAIIADVVAHLEPQRKASVLTALEEISKKLDEAGIGTTINEVCRGRADSQTVLALNRAYYELGMSCPFLVEGSCSIYSHRPSRCREYSVLTPSEWCADVFSNGVKRLPLTIRFSEAFSHAWASLVKQSPVIIPLVKALEWVGENPHIYTSGVSDAGMVARAILDFACRKANERAAERMNNR